VIAKLASSKKGLIGIAAFILLAAGGFVIYARTYPPTRSQADVCTLQTAITQRGNQAIYASDSGTLAAATEFRSQYETARMNYENLTSPSVVASVFHAADPAKD
jgi:hypothetical protein